MISVYRLAVGSHLPATTGVSGSVHFLRFCRQARTLDVRKTVCPHSALYLCLDPSGKNFFLPNSGTLSPWGRGGNPCPPWRGPGRLGISQRGGDDSLSPGERARVRGKRVGAGCAGAGWRVVATPEALSRSASVKPPALPEVTDVRRRPGRREYHFHRGGVHHWDNATG